MRLTLFKQNHFEDRYLDLAKRAEFDIDFALLTAFAAIICSFGFRTDSASVIIGSMLISPLLDSIVAIPSAVMHKDWKTLLRNLGALFWGLSIVVLVGLISTHIYPIEFNSEVTERIHTTLIDYFFIAFFSGAAGTFAYYWPNSLGSVVGIAISVALVPPAVLLGMASTVSNVSIFTYSALIVLTNIIGIILGAFCILFFFKFLNKEQRRVIEEE